jgi:hypothetical protein
MANCAMQNKSESVISWIHRGHSQAQCLECSLALNSREIIEVAYPRAVEADRQGSSLASSIGDKATDRVFGHGWLEYAWKHRCMMVVVFHLDMIYI